MTDYERTKDTLEFRRLTEDDLTVSTPDSNTVIEFGRDYVTLLGLEVDASELTFSFV